MSNNSNKQNSRWGGRFEAGPHPLLQQINNSLHIDKRLAEVDVKGSKAQAEMLGATGIIGKDIAKKLWQGLDAIAAEIADGKFNWREELEDVHMNIEARLEELVGQDAGWLHTARSRNDQVATDFRLWAIDDMKQVQTGIHFLQSALIARAEENAETVLPGYTHFQSAQPVSLGHHLLAYVEMLSRDKSRLEDCAKRANESPLGAAALAGTSFPIDREMTAKALGFNNPMRNSMDAVASRDFALEYLSAMTILGVHLSRLAEELIIWGNDRFDFIRLPDNLSTGSSIMPQKRNPDAAELVRAKVGELMGCFVQLAAVMKALPLAYNKDMQEDKPPVFAASDTVKLSLAVMRAMIETLTVHPEKMKAAALSGFAIATDLADRMVQQLRIPFREAHHLTGRLVKLAESGKKDLTQLSESDLQSVDKRLHAELLSGLTLDHALNSRDSLGGTAPKRVATAAKSARKIHLGE